VNGEVTELEHPFTPDDSYIPTDPYGLSKYKHPHHLKLKKPDLQLVVFLYNRHNA
jgi:hypothetical protein